jgi:hypothetical protein
VVSPVSNPEHNYIAVQTFACRPSVDLKKIMQPRALLPAARDNQPVEESPKLPRQPEIKPTTPSARSNTLWNNGGFPGRKAQTQFPSHNMSRLPEDLELELQML